MKKYLFFMVFMSFLLVAPLAKAHFLVENNNVGVLIHIDPNDEPVAGQKSTLHLFFQTKKGASKILDCSCTLEILNSGVSLAKLPILTSDKDSQEFVTPFNFPSKAVYTLHIFGNDAGVLFDTHYDLRVDKEVEKTPVVTLTRSQSLALKLGEIVLIIVGVVISLKLFI